MKTEKEIEEIIKEIQKYTMYSNYGKKKFNEYFYGEYCFSKPPIDKSKITNK